MANQALPQRGTPEWYLFTFGGRIEAALSSGTVEQRLEKVIRFLAESDPNLVAADRAERVERLVMYDRPGLDPRGAGNA